MAFDDIVLGDAPKTEGLNQKLDYPFLLLFQMQQISSKFANGDTMGASFLIKIMESSCPFRVNDGWKEQIDALDKEFLPLKSDIESRKKSMYADVRSRAIVDEGNMLVDYWIRRYDLLMSIPKMQNMLYKETEVGIIR